MGGFITDGSLAWILLDRTTVHLPRRSDWRVASTTGWDASVGTPWIKFAADRSKIVIPLFRTVGAAVVETQILTGLGLGVSAGISVQLPFLSYAWSTSADPGFGTPVYETMFCPEPLEARHLQGFCYAMNLSGVWSKSNSLAGRQASAGILIFTDKLSFGSILPTSINAVAFVASLGSQAVDFASIGAEIVVYNLTLKAAPTIGSTGR